MGEQTPLETVQRVNRAWRAGDSEALEPLFHPDAVIVQPGFQQRCEGRMACVQSYLDFAAVATVDRLDQFDVDVHVAGDTAVVTYGFRILYTIEDERRFDQGVDVYVLGRGPDRHWRVTWRTLIMET